MKTLRNLTMVFILLAGMSFTGSQAGEKNEGSTKLYAVFFHADWCSACKAISPKLNEIRGQFENMNVRFVDFDFTNKKAKMKTKELAKELGLSEVLASNQGTGFVVLVDAKTKSQKAVLTNRQDTKEMLVLVGKYI